MSPALSHRRRSATFPRAVRTGRNVDVAAISLAGDVLIATGVCALHSVLIHLMAITYSVAVNSPGNALVSSNARLGVSPDYLRADCAR